MVQVKRQRVRSNHIEAMTKVAMCVMAGMIIMLFIVVVGDYLREDKVSYNCPNIISGCPHEFAIKIVPVEGRLYLYAKCKYCGGMVPIRAGLHDSDRQSHETDF